MKSIKNLYIGLVCLVLVFMNPGCNDILTENPQSILTPEFFKTAQGIEGGVIAAYSNMRYIYGPEPYFSITTYGTDEFTTGGGTALTNPLNVYTALDAANGNVGTVWQRAYPAINTCNGVIQLGPEADLSDDVKNAIIAEAKYLRAQYYFLLAQTYGGATLDLGSGVLKFNESPSNEFSRASFIETMDVVINDAIDASNELDDAPRQPGRVWKASAYHLLAKAYLTKAWNTRDNADFQSALDAVNALISDPSSPTGNYGAELLSDFATVFAEGNDDNAEILYSVQKNADDIFNERETNNLANRTNMYFRSLYYDTESINNGVVDGIVRSPQYGRPWWRVQPTEWLLRTAFNNKDMDSRYAGTFETVWMANDEGAVFPTWTAGDVTAGYVNQDGTPAVAGEPKFQLGDTSIYMIPELAADLPADIKASKGYTVLTLDDVSPNVQRRNWPGMSKHNAALRPIADTDTDSNIASYRPHIVYRFAEVYMIGAEAAHMLGDDALAAQYINTLRRRAARPGFESAMEITAADIDIDFILDERSREFTGELMRWYDLARTGKLAERATAHNDDVAAGAIEDYHYLRPIPQGTIDLTVDPTTADGKFPQNPGYPGI